MKRMLPLFIIVIVTTALADVPPPTWSITFPAGSDKAHAPLSHGFRMGSLDIQFEKTTLADVQQAIGAGKIAWQGDAGEAILWLCYTFKDPKNSGRIWVISHAEMGSDDHLIGHVDAVFDSSVVPTADCPALPEKFLPMSFDHGVWLGMKGADAVQALGPDHTKQGEWIIYSYLGKVPDNGNCQPDGYDLSSYLVFEATGGTVQSIKAGQVTSC
jgi:hypothetical protein